MQKRMGVEKTAIYRPRIDYIKNDKNSLLYTDFDQPLKTYFGVIS